MLRLQDFGGLGRDARPRRLERARTGPVWQTSSIDMEPRKPSVVTEQMMASGGAFASISETAARTRPVVVAANMGFVIADPGSVFIDALPTVEDPLAAHGVDATVIHGSRALDGLRNLAVGGIADLLGQQVPELIVVDLRLLANARDQAREGLEGAA